MKGMSQPRVLLDTNVLISGLVFAGGNEHRVLEAAERGEIWLVLPEFVLEETRRVLGDKFSGYEGLLDVFLSRLEYDEVPWEAIEEVLPSCRGAIRDAKDVPILASIIVEAPGFVVTGDAALRDDLSRCERFSGVRVLSSAQFLAQHEGRT